MGKNGSSIYKLNLGSSNGAMEPVCLCFAGPWLVCCRLGGSISELLLQSFSFRNDLQHHRSEDPHQHLDIIYVLYIVYCVVKYLLFFVLDASY